MIFYENITKVNIIIIIMIMLKIIMKWNECEHVRKCVEIYILYYVCVF